MTQEEKQKLLVALCGYLPYDTQCQGFYEEEPDYLNQYSKTEKIVGHMDGIDHIGFDDGEIYITIEGIPCELSDVKLYLRPMESMTEEEKKELNKYIFSHKGLRYFWFDDGIMYSGPDNQCFIGIGNDTIDRMVDWLNAHYFDYRGLIPAGLALPAKEGMYND